MSAPVRMVCGGCLRSVEVSPGLAGETSNLCPYCGREIDSQQDNARTQTGMTQGLEGMLEAEPSASDSSLGWTETWSRGSLGSLGRFQLRERLGDGGFGQVFLAFDPRLDRDVALKVLKQPDPNERVMERFFREARAAARLDHPNIVAVHDAGFENGVSAWDRHPSALGHRALFHALRSELLRRGNLPGLPLGSAASDPGDGDLPEAVLSRGRSVLPRTSGDGGFRLQEPFEICPDLIEN